MQQPYMQQQQYSMQQPYMQQQPPPMQQPYTHPQEMQQPQQYMQQQSQQYMQQQYQQPPMMAQPQQQQQQQMYPPQMPQADMQQQQQQPQLQMQMQHYQQPPQESTSTAPQEVSAPPPEEEKKDESFMINTQHNDMIHDVQIDYYGSKLATASSDRTIQIYEISANNVHTQTAVLKGHTGPVWGVAWAHPRFGVLLASCSFDGSVMLHRETERGNWTRLASWDDLHESSVNGVGFAPAAHEGGLVLAAASSDGYFSVLRHDAGDDSWEVTKVRDNPLGVNSLSWISKNELVTGGCDNRVRFWKCGADDGDPTKWEEQVSVAEPSHTDWVRDVAHDGSEDLSGGGNGGYVASGGEDGAVLIWEKNEDGIRQPILMHKFPDPVWGLSWSVTGNILAVSSGEGDVSLWKQVLSGEWERVSTVEDVAGGGGKSDLE